MSRAPASEGRSGETPTWRRSSRDGPSEKFLAKRQMIVDAAAGVFREKGYANGSLEDVAEVLGIRKASLYHYISSKHRLLQLVFRQALIEGLDGLRALADVEDPAERLAALIRFQVELVSGNLDHFAVFFDHFSNRHERPVDDDSQIVREVRELEREYFSTFVATVRLAVEAGAIPDVHPVYGAQAIMGMSSWIYKWFDPARHDVETVVDAYTNLVVRRNARIVSSR